MAAIQFTYQTLLALRSTARIRVSCAIGYNYRGRTSASEPATCLVVKLEAI
jgi:hypothetical protein